MDIFIQQILNGLVLGSVYAIIALGYTMVYGILGIINFAHGDVLMVGAMVALSAIGVMSNHFPGGHHALILVIALLVAAVVCSVVGYTIERVAYRPLRRAPRLAPLISAIGMSIFLEQTAQRIFGTGVRAFDTPTLLSGSVIVNLGKEFGPPIPISKIGIIIFIAALVLMYSLYSLVQRTRIGRAMRAVAEDK